MKKTILCLLSLVVIAATVGCDSKNESAEAPPPAEETAPAADETAKADEAAKKEAEAAEAAGEAEADESQWVSSPLYGVKFRVPADWSVTTGDEGVSTTSADGATTAILVGSESENMVQAAINDLKSQIELKDVRFEKSGLTTINGLAGSRGSGAAVVVKEDGDEEIQFLAYSLRVGKKTVTLMVFSEATMYEAQKDIIDGIAQTITKTN